MSISYFPRSGGYAAAQTLVTDARCLAADAASLDGCVAELEDVTREGDSRLRSAALAALFELAPERAEACALRALTHDTDNDVRGDAARLLGAATSNDARDALADALLGSPLVASGAQQGLEARAMHDGALRAWALERANAWAEAQDDAHKNAASFLWDLGVSEPRPGAVLLIDANVATDASDASDAADAAELLRRGFRDRDQPTKLDASAFSAMMQAIEDAFQGAPSRVFDRLAPVLRGARGAAPRSAAHEITLRIVEHMRDRIVAREPVDTRFRAEVEPFADAHGTQLAQLAESFIAGIDWVVGGRKARTLRSIFLPEGEMLAPPMPVVLAGIAIDANEPHVQAMARRFVDFDAPPGFALYQHQYGGTACLQLAVLGYAVRAPAELTHALEVTARESLDSWGDALTESLRNETEQALAPMLRLGAMATAHEALLTWTAPRAGAAFTGRDVLWFEYAHAPWDPDVMMNQGDVFTTRGTYGPPHDDALQRLARELGQTAITLAVAWNNSD